MFPYGTNSMTLLRMRTISLRDAGARFHDAITAQYFVSKNAIYSGSVSISPLRPTL